MIHASFEPQCFCYYYCFSKFSTTSCCLSCAPLGISEYASRKRDSSLLQKTLWSLASRSSKISRRFICGIPNVVLYPLPLIKFSADHWKISVTLPVHPEKWSPDNKVFLTKVRYSRTWYWRKTNGISPDTFHLSLLTSFVTSFPLTPSRGCF